LVSSTLTQRKSLIRIGSEREPEHDVQYLARGFVFDRGTKVNAYYRVRRTSMQSVAFGSALLTLDSKRPSMKGYFMGTHSTFPDKLIRGDITLKRA